MAEIMGYQVGSLPTIDVSGWLSNTWIYVLIIGLIGFILCCLLAGILFFLTYNKRVVILEELVDGSYKVVLKTRARQIRVGKDGGKLLKTFFGGHYVSAYGKKIDKNTYMFILGEDGYLYNARYGSWDKKLGIIGIEPVDRDVRQQHTAQGHLIDMTYGKTGFLEKYTVHIMLFFFLLAMIIGFYVIAGKMTEGMQELSKAIAQMVEFKKNYAVDVVNSGIIPAK